MALGRHSLPREGVEMKRSIVRVMALLALGGLVLVLGPARAPTRADAAVDHTGLTSFFVVGDQSAGAPTIGTEVQFWGAQWAKDNSLSGGPASASFKGYADSGSVTMTGGLCAGEWFTSPGNSFAPPATLTTPFVVILTSTVVKSGPVITGDVVGAVVVIPDPGYAPDPGLAGTGTIQQVLCPSPTSTGD